MSGSDREEQIVSYKNGEHVELEDEVAYSSWSGDEDFASERISREYLCLIRPFYFTKYGWLSGSVSDTSPEKKYLVI